MNEPYYIGLIGPNGELPGDIVVCIDDNKNIKVPSNHSKSIYGVEKSKHLKENNKYRIVNPDGGAGDLKVETLNNNGYIDGDTDIPHYYDWNRFISLKEYRKRQIEKILNERV